MTSWLVGAALLALLLDIFAALAARSALREAVCRLDRQATATPDARDHLANLIDLLRAQLDDVAAGVGRLERAAGVVADDLADAQARADTTSGDAGAQADAASRSGEA